VAATGWLLGEDLLRWRLRGIRIAAGLGLLAFALWLGLSVLNR
jgi:hypothetical protein